MAELTQLAPYLDVSLRLWLRCAPVFLFTPYLAAGALPLLWGAALSWAFAGSLAPLVIAGCTADAACAAALSGGRFFGWGAAAGELVGGTVVALGVGLPLFAFRTLGSIAGALAGGGATAGEDSQLGRVAALVAVVSALSADVLSGISRWLLTLPLTAARPVQPELFRSLGDELLRAFDIGVSLAGPLLLGALIAAIFVGLWSRLASLSGARVSAVGPLLLPWLGIALVSLCVANWLDSVPELMRSFAESGARLLNGVP
jgi:flagellar biosynthesis protein FliR